MPRLNAFATACVLGLLLSWSEAARAGAPSELRIAADGRCPAGDRVQRQLVPLLAETAVFTGEREGIETAWVADQGQRFSVKVRHVERVIQDEARDCEERARIAAVFIALVVDPPLPPAADSGGTEPPQGPHPIAEPKPLAPTAPLSAAGPSIATMAGATAALAPGSEGGRTWGAGPVLRCLLSGSVWDLSLAAAFVSPAQLDLKSGGVRLTRVPLDLSGAIVLGSSRVRGFFGAGLAGDLLHLSGTEVTRARSTVRFDVGFRSHLGARVLFGSGIWGVAEMSGRYFPRPYEFEVPPRGIVGHTPSVWLATTVGALFEIH
jgi:hypothetical protein